MPQGDDKRHYQDLIKNRFEINEVIKIERQDDQDTILHKFLDFSAATVLNLIECGTKDALVEIISKLNDDINDLDSLIFKNLSKKVRKQLSVLMNEMKSDLNFIKVSYDPISVSTEPIPRYHQKINEYSKKLNDEQYNVLVRLLNTIKSSLIPC